MYRDEELVDVVATYGLEPYMRRWLDGSESPWLPLCPEQWAGNKIPDYEVENAESFLLEDCPTLEELLLAGELAEAISEMWNIPQRCTEYGTEDVKDWPPGIYLNYLRRLVTGDSPRTVYEDLRRVEAGLDAPVEYIELLRRQLGRYLESDDGEREGSASSPGTASFPEWPSQDSWLLVGDPVEGEGFLAYGGCMVRGLPPQVFKLIFMMRDRQERYPVQEALKSKLIKPKVKSNADGALKKLIGRANAFFEALGAGKEENPLRFSEGDCVSSVLIKHVREVSRIAKLPPVTE